MIPDRMGSATAIAPFREDIRLPRADYHELRDYPGFLFTSPKRNRISFRFFIVSKLRLLLLRAEIFNFAHDNERILATDITTWK